MPYLIIYVEDYDKLLDIAKTIAREHRGLKVNVLSDLGEKVIARATSIGILHSGLLEYIKSKEYQESAEKARSICIELEKYGFTCISKEKEE